MAETRNKRAERAGEASALRNARRYWADKEAAAEALRNPKAYAFSIGFNVENANFTVEEFEAAYDETIAAPVEATTPALPAEILELLGDDYIVPAAHKGHFHLNRNKVFRGGYLVTFKGNSSELLEHTIPATVASIQEDIANSGIEHGMVQLNLYTLKDKNPTHHFVMQANENVFTEITAEENNAIEVEVTKI